jgi:hypothetical protein
MSKISIYAAFIFASSLFAEIPESALNNMVPMVEIYHPVSTTKSEAQKSFDRGLTYIFAFNHDIAFASFEKAAQLDPSLAMAYWGMALARGQNVNEDVTPENEIKCYNYIQKALKLSGNASANEKAYISALADRYTNDPNADLIPLRFRYRDAMKKVIDAYPEDLDALTLYAESILDLDPWKWWTNDGKPMEGTMEAVGKLEFVLSRDPLHIGANHFYIHAWEESPTPERALMSAHRLEFILPESGHLLHMPCHIFLPVGDYESAVHNSKLAIAQDRAYFKEFGLSAGTYPLHYLTHNTYILARTYMLMEDYENAIKTALEAANFIGPYLEKMRDLSHYASIPLEIYLYFHKWNEILEYKFPINYPSEQAYWHYSRAKAFAALDDLESALKEKELMLRFKEQITSQEEIAKNHAGKVIALAEIDLEATMARVQKKHPEYISLLNRAVELQDQLNYDEPPAWYISMRIPLGAALLEQQNYADAEAVFQKTLKSLQRNGRALFGLFLSLKGQNRTIDSFWIKREMTAALKNSSNDLQLENL